MSGPLPWQPGKIIAGTPEPGYEKGDRVCVRDAHGALQPGVVIGHYMDWNLYRVVYMVDIAGQSPRAVEEWRLAPRREGEEC
jgi:hypothetical protein